MKEFGGAKLQLTAIDYETEEKYTLSINNLVEDANVESIKAVSQSIDTLVHGDIDYAKVVESHYVVL